MRRLLLILAILSLSVLPLLAVPSVNNQPKTLDKPLPDDPLKVTIHRLDNGLTVYLSENHETPRITANIVIKAGGRHDPREATGMAHYLEHMLFKGSQNFGTLDWKAEKPHLKKIRELYEELFEIKDPAERQKVIKQIDDENKLASEFAIPNEL